MSILCAVDVRLLDKAVHTYQNMKDGVHPFGLYLAGDLSTITRRAEASNKQILGAIKAPDLDIGGIDLSPDVSIDGTLPEPPTLPSPSDGITYSFSLTGG
jgi:hypothetical protein